MINAKKRFINNIIRIGLLGLFGCLFLTGNVHAINYLDLGQEGYPTYGYNTGNYNLILDTNGEYKIEKNGETKNLMYGWASVWGRPFLYYFGYYNDRLGIFQFMDDQPNYNISTVNRIWYNATIYNYTTQSGKFLNGQSLPSASNCSSSKPDNNTWQCYFKLRDNFGEEYNEKIDGMIWYNNNSSFMPCFIYEELNEIVCMDQRTTDSNNYANYDSINRYNFETFNNSMGIYPTFIVNDSDSGGGTFIPLDSDVDMVINYYEQRGYRESMCYVGTDNLTATFGTSGVSFDEGSGDSIFGLYNSIYSGFGNNIIQNVGKFINVRDINYGQWFYCDGENCPRWLAELTGNDVNVNLNYTGLTFPFANKPVAIYFMASNLYETYNVDTHGMDVAFYCYSKLNRDSIVDGSINYSDIKEQAGTGVTNKVDTYNQYLIDYYTPKGTFQVPTSGEFWNSFGSGEDYSGVNNTDMSETFSNFFTKFTNVFQNWSPAYSTGIIPDWIIFPLIFLLLFRIMKH